MDATPFRIAVWEPCFLLHMHIYKEAARSLPGNVTYLKTYQFLWEENVLLLKVSNDWESYFWIFTFAMRLPDLSTGGWQRMFFKCQFPWEVDILLILKPSHASFLWIMMKLNPLYEEYQYTGCHLPQFHTVSHTHGLTLRIYVIPSSKRTPMSEDGQFDLTKQSPSSRQGKMPVTFLKKANNTFAF